MGEQSGLNKLCNGLADGSAFRVWQPDEHFDYALAQGGFKTQSYLKVMDWQAESSTNPGTDRANHCDCAR